MQVLLHGHHVGLLSVVTSKRTRVAEIKRDKPSEQRELRLRLLQQVPLRLLPSEIVQVARECDKAKKAWKKAQDKAVRNFHAACAKHKDELEMLHKKLCVPDCPGIENEY